VKTPNGYLTADTFKAEYLYERNDDWHSMYFKMMVGGPFPAAEKLTLRKVWFNGDLFWDRDRDGDWADVGYGVGGWVWPLLFPEIVKTGAKETYPSNCTWQ